MKTPPPSLEYCLLQVKMYAAKVALTQGTVRLDIDLVALAKWTKKAREALLREDGV